MAHSCAHTHNTSHTNARVDTPVFPALGWLSNCRLQQPCTILARAAAEQTRQTRNRGPGQQSRRCEAYAHLSSGQEYGTRKMRERYAHAGTDALQTAADVRHLMQIANRARRNAASHDEFCAIRMHPRMLLSLVAHSTHDGQGGTLHEGMCVAGGPQSRGGCAQVLAVQTQKVCAAHRAGWGE
eukprot:3160355-Prymnesium_polylepis.2